MVRSVTPPSTARRNARRGLIIACFNNKKTANIHSLRGLSKHFVGRFQMLDHIHQGNDIEFLVGSQIRDDAPHQLPAGFTEARRGGIYPGSFPTARCCLAH